MYVWLKTVLKRPLEMHVVSAICLSLIITLYLAPSKYFKADFAVAIMLIFALKEHGLFRSGFIDGAKRLMPLLGIFVYVLAFALFSGSEYSNGLLYLKNFLYGVAPFLLFYVVFRNRVSEQMLLLLSIVLIVPGLVHLFYMYLDILLAVLHKKVPIILSYRFGFLEYIKDTPRVGRRYLSLALLHVLGGGVFLIWHFRHGTVRRLALGLSGICVLSLVLLDARAAYASVIIAGAFLVAVVGPSRTWLTIKAFLPTAMSARLLLGMLLIATVVLGYNAGRLRWMAMSDSVIVAAHDVFESEVELAQRPFVSQQPWNAPIEDIDVCYQEGHFRCKVDQSAYLRMAWLLSGVRSVIEHPWGIGYSEDYMARLWGVQGNEGVYRRTDSFLVETLVSYGLPGILLFAFVVIWLLHSLRAALRVGTATAELFMVSVLILASVGRALVDVLDEGFTRYLMALFGIYLALLFQNKLHVKEFKDA